MTLFQKLALTFTVIMGFGLVFWGNEHIDRMASAGGHILILLGLILAIRMNKSSESDEDKSSVPEINHLATEIKPVSNRIKKDKLQRLPK